MRDAIRCCIACILPCGALDVVRIVHANGRVEEISGAVKAADVLQVHPKHVLRKPPSTAGFESRSGIEDKAAVEVPPTAQLKRGKIYFLVPVSEKEKKKKKRKKKEKEEVAKKTETVGVVGSDRYLSEILSEKASGLRERRRGRVGVWRPHLESISEIDL